MGEPAVRFLIGGVLVAIFAVLGDLFKPKSFAGVFAAAPSVALATLALTVGRSGREYAALEARSMVVGAAAFIAYTTFVSLWLRRRGGRPAVVAACGILAWGAVVAAGWLSFLRPA